MNILLWAAAALSIFLWFAAPARGDLLYPSAADVPSATNSEVTIPATPDKPPDAGSAPEAAPKIPETPSPVPANSDPERPKPLKTYFLSVPPEGVLYRVNFKPPAAKISVASQSGDTIVRCGDNVKAYRCQPGNTLKISYDPETAIETFWVQNTSEVNVVVRIEVYEQYAE